MLIGKQSPFLHCLNLKVNALQTSKTSRTTYRMMRRKIPEDLKALYLFLLHCWCWHLLSSNRIVLQYKSINKQPSSTTIY
jgi:hypothetical protein